jgi:hypothetical protein
MATRRPRIGQVFIDVQRYWEDVKPQEPWAHDFISVHGPRQYDDGGYTLISPLCIINERPLADRPQWESFTFPSKQEAVTAARDIAKGRARDMHIFVVIVPN